jgi:hypothetical protein
LADSPAQTTLWCAPPHCTANDSEWYAYNMTVNELITKLDLLPADLEVRGTFRITERPGSWELQDAAISEDGESVSLVF